MRGVGLTGHALELNDLSRCGLPALLDGVQLEPRVL